jgi:hypothetical protein
VRNVEDPKFAAAREEAVTYLHLPVGRTPPSLEGYRPFKALLVIEQPVTSEWQSIVSEWLVQGGCLYMMAWGRDCSSWDDSVDYANLSAFDFGEIPEDALVMTTWHADVPLREALWFAAHVAVHPTVALDRTIIVHISVEERRAELLRAFQQAQSDEV